MHCDRSVLAGTTLEIHLRPFLPPTPLVRKHVGLTLYIGGVPHIGGVPPDRVQRSPIVIAQHWQYQYPACKFTEVLANPQQRGRGQRQC